MDEKAGPRLISIEEGHARFAPTGFATHMSLVGLLELAMIECQQYGQTLAMVARSDQFDPARFAQRVAENRGLFIGAFADDQAAREWLSRPRPPKSP